MNIKQPLLYYFSLFLQVCYVNNIIIIYNILAVRKGSNIIMVFNIHISVKSGKSVFSVCAEKLFDIKKIVSRLDCWWKFIEWTQDFFNDGGKDSFHGFHGDMND